MSKIEREQKYIKDFDIKWNKANTTREEQSNVMEVQRKERKHSGQIWKHMEEVTFKINLQILL